MATDFSEGAIEMALQNDLDKFHPASAQDGRWKERVAYLRGDKKHEGNGPGQFRIRKSALGDIINSVRNMWVHLRIAAAWAKVTANLSIAIRVSSL